MTTTRRPLRGALVAGAAAVIASLLVAGPAAATPTPSPNPSPGVTPSTTSTATPSATNSAAAASPGSVPTVSRGSGASAVSWPAAAATAAPSSTPTLGPAAIPAGQVRPLDAPVGSGPGITPTDLRTAYGVAGATAPAGSTVGIVVDDNAPDVESDLDAYRARWGMPACTSANGCFRKVDQTGAIVPAGYPPNTTLPPLASPSWQFSTAEYTQAVSAICPSCHLLLVENSGNQATDGTGAAARMAQTLGATVISVPSASGAVGDPTASWAGITVPVFTGAGNSAWNNSEATGTSGPTYPAALANVITVGGTTAAGSGGSLGTQTAWIHGGSGCSSSLPASASQQAYFTATGLTPGMPDSCGAAGTVRRAYTDLSAIADPVDPGFAVDRAGTWTTIGGTGLSTQVVLGLAAYAGRRPVGSSIADVAYTRAAAGLATGLQDVTSGSNAPAGSACTGARICTASAGWDGPTGLGTPNGTALFAPLIAAGVPDALPGASVTVTGSNAFPSETVTVSSGGTSLATTTATASGTWTSVVVVPSATRGEWPVTMTGSRSGLTATTTVHTPAGHLDVAATALTPGQTFGATASDMWPGEKVAFHVAGGAPDVVVAADGAGKAAATLVLPLPATSSTAVTATGGSSGLAPTATVSVAPATLTPAVATSAPSTVVGLTGTGFPVGTPLQLSASGATGRAVPAKVGTDGTFTASVTLAVDATGSVSVTATAGGRTATAVVTVPTAAVVTPATIGVGASATVTGSGFAAGEQVALSSGTPGQLVLSAPVTAGADGAVSATVSVAVTACPTPAAAVTLTGRSSRRSASGSIGVLVGNALHAGCTAPAGTVLRSASGQYEMAVQSDGNVVLYRMQSTVWVDAEDVVWATSTSDPNAFLAMQTDGNLVVYGSTRASWNSNTWHDGPGSTLYLQDDGNLVVYRADGTPTWNAGYSLVETRQGTSGALEPGWSLHTVSGRYTLVMQGDGNLVEYDNRTRSAVWDTKTQNHPGVFFNFTGYYGVLHLYDPARGEIATFGPPGDMDSYVVVQEDANVVYYDRGVAKWSRMYG